ncbi:fimbrial assembly protein, partial [Citrobacter rodentium]
QEKHGDEKRGLKTELQSTVSLAGSLSLSASAAHFSGGYRELADALVDDFQPYDNTYATNLNWSTSLAGAFSAGYTYNQSGGENHDSRYVLLSWSKSFKYASVSVNWQSAVGNVDEDQDDDMIYVNLSIPLGGAQSISSYMRKQGDRTSYGVQNAGSLTQNTYYSLSVDRDNDSHENSYNGSLSSNLHYTQLGVGGGSNGNHQRNYNAMLSGGVAMHKSGVTFTPYAIRNTFAIAKLNEEKAGVEINTPQGVVWTDAWGQAVIPGLNEWRNSRIEVDANKLPVNMTLANGMKYLAAAHASVSEVNFKILNSRRVMIRVKRADGSTLAKGISIVDEKGNYIVTSVDDGHVFLNDADQISSLYASDDDHPRLCKIDYTLSNDRDEQAFYEEVDGICQ